MFSNGGVASGQPAGIVMTLGEIGEQIQEVMESYEVELDGTVYPGINLIAFWWIP